MNDIEKRLDRIGNFCLLIAVLCLIAQALILIRTADSTPAAIARFATNAAFLLIAIVIRTVLL